MGNAWSQSFPPAPTLTEANLPSQNGKVFIVTGGASGVGFELSRILYQAGGKVYIAGRSEANAQGAISQIKALETKSSGELAFLFVDLSDLKTIKPATQSFTASESRLDVLFNNAGVSIPPRGSVSAQGHELQMATNCLGHYLLTQLLLPILKRTAQEKGTSQAAVRVVWTSSLVVDLSAPKGGFDMIVTTKPPSDPPTNYNISKTGNWFLASSLAAQAGRVDDGAILSVTQNPGNIKTSLLRHAPGLVKALVSTILHPARMGAYTELWAGLSEELTLEDGGGYVIPWGRRHPAPRSDLIKALKRKEEGGTGLAESFVEWCEQETKGFR